MTAERQSQPITGTPPPRSRTRSFKSVVRFLVGSSKRNNASDFINHNLLSPRAISQPKRIDSEAGKSLSSAPAPSPRRASVASGWRSGTFMASKADSDSLVDFKMEHDLKDLFFPAFLSPSTSTCGSPTQSSPAALNERWSSTSSTSSIPSNHDSTFSQRSLHSSVSSSSTTSAPNSPPPNYPPPSVPFPTLDSQQAVDIRVKLDRLRVRLGLCLVYLVSLDLSPTLPSPKLSLLSASNLPHPAPEFDASLHFQALRAREGGLLYRKKSGSDVLGYETGILIPVMEARKIGWVLCGYSSVRRRFGEADLEEFAKTAERLESWFPPGARTET